MKTQTSITGKIRNVMSQQLIITILLFVLFFIGLAKVSFGRERTNYGQTKFIDHFGVSFKSTFTADGLGTFYIPSVFYAAKRNVFSVGTILHKNNTQVNGLQLNYEYTLVDRNSRNTPYCDWLELYAFVNSNYHCNASLGNLTQEMEHLSHPESNLDIKNIKLNVLETYAGIGLRIDLLKKLKWINCVGVGAYRMLNAPEGMDHSKQAASLMLRTGISYQF